MEKNIDNREFKRHQIEFMTHITAKDIEGNKYKDQAILKDASGGGAFLITYNGNNYYLGQQLDISICLPKINEMEAFMEGEGQVVRIVTYDDSNKISQAQKTGIAVEIFKNWHLKRINPRYKTTPDIKHD